MMPAPSSAEPFQILLFSQDFDYAAAAVAAGVDAVVVDWEWRGKAERQFGRRTEINHGTKAHLAGMRRRVTGHLICRINNIPILRVEELRCAADLGADEIWLPMVRSVAEVEECLSSLPGHCRLGILSETAEAIELAEQWAQLPLSRVFIGLNDLQIDTRRPVLFSALCDGAVETFRAHYEGPLGFAGVTHPDLGYPVPCHLLMAEMARLSCSFAVARRSFRADVSRPDLGPALHAIRTRYAELRRRDIQAVAADHEQLCAQVNGLMRTETQTNS
jgi:hypothetical protein